MKVKQTIKYRTQCPKCGSILEFTIDEIDFQDEPFNRGGFIKCPICQGEIETHNFNMATGKYELHKHSIECIYKEESKK